MPKIILSIMIMGISTGCITTEVSPEVDARTAFDQFLVSVEKNRIGEVWYRLSFTVRDKITFKMFSDDWANIKSRIKNVKTGVC